MNNLTDTATVGAKLKELRGNKSRREVAEAIGVSEASIMFYEQGVRTPRDKVKVALANYYGKSVKSIFFA